MELRRLLPACALSVLLVALSAAPAGAATVSVSAGKLTIAGGEGPDDVYLYCDAGFIKIGALPKTDPSTGPATCESIDSIEASLGGGDDVLYLYEVDPADLGAFSGISVTAGPGYDQVLGLYDLSFEPPGYDPRMFVDLGPNLDRVIGGVADDVLIGGSGPDVVRGGFGRDRISGGPGNDTLSGGTHNDRVVGGPGKDRIEGGRGKDKLKGGPGDDEVSQSTLK